MESLHSVQGMLTSPAFERTVLTGQSIFLLRYFVNTIIHGARKNPRSCAMSETANQIAHLPRVSGSKDRREKFVRLAESRTAKAMKAIRVIGNLGNKSQYEYDERDVKKIIAALHAEVDQLRNRLSESDRKKAVEFKL